MYPTTNYIGYVSSESVPDAKIGSTTGAVGDGGLETSTEGTGTVAFRYEAGNSTPVE